MMKWWREHKDRIHLFASLVLGAGLLLHWGLKLSLLGSAAMAVSLGLASVIAFDVLLARRHRKQSTPIRVEIHPELGEVRIFPDRWEARVSGPPFQNSVEVSGHGSATGPSEAQAHLFRQIRGRYPSLLQMAFRELGEHFSAVKPPLKAEDLRMRSLYLGGIETPSFSFSFDVPSRSAEIPDGLYADFVDFDVTEAGLVH
jgi:hypothetical protein